MADKKNKSPLVAISIVVVILVIAVGIFVLNKPSTSQTSKTGQVAGTSDNKKTGNNPKITLDKAYQAKAIDMNAKESKTKIAMNVKFAEKTDDILIKGTPATAKNGSKFLVFQVELQNPSNERLIVSPLDLLRLVVDNQKRAAEIYTEEAQRVKGSVIIEPDSTKVTRVGFVLTPDIVDKELKLQIGEINGTDKEIIDIKI